MDIWRATSSACHRPEGDREVKQSELPVCLMWINDQWGSLHVCPTSSLMNWHNVKPVDPYDNLGGESREAPKIFRPKK